MWGWRLLSLGLFLPGSSAPGPAGAISSPMSLLMVKQNSLKHEKGGPNTTETAFKSLLLAWEQH